MKVGICLPLYNFVDWTKECIKCINKHTRPGTYELAIFNNASTDDTEKYLQQVGYNYFNSPVNVGFGQAINYMVQGFIKKGGFDYFCLMHNDIFVTEDWLDFLVSELQETKGCLKLGANNIVDKDAILKEEVKRNYVALKARGNSIGPANTDPCIIKKACFDIVGYFDPLFEQQECDDVDYNKRIADAGYSVMTTNKVYVWHALTLSRKTTPEYSRVMVENKEKFFKKHNVKDFTQWNYSMQKSVQIDGNFYILKGVF